MNNALTRWQEELRKNGAPGVVFQLTDADLQELVDCIEKPQDHTLSACPPLSACPFCGSEAKVLETLYRVTCSNYQHCPVKPSANSNDLATAVAKWEQRGT